MFRTMRRDRQLPDRVDHQQMGEWASLSHHLPLITNLPHLLLSASEKLGTQP